MHFNEKCKKDDLALNVRKVYLPQLRIFKLLTYYSSSNGSLWSLYMCMCVCSFSAFCIFNYI